jgi:hypothetical protein
MKVDLDDILKGYQSRMKDITTIGSTNLKESF